VKKYKEALLSFKRVSIVTLTIKDHHPLSRVIKKKLEQQIRNFIKRLNRKFNYKIQYVRILELVKKADGYYYHYHILFDLPFIAQRTLSKMWLETTGSSVVHIAILKSEDGKALGITWNRLPKEVKMRNSSNYITKYLAKPVPNIDLDEYSRIVYRAHFVETHLTSSLAQNSSTRSEFLICKKCGDILNYAGESEIGDPCDFFGGSYVL